MSRFQHKRSALAVAAVMLFFALITWRWSWNDGPKIIRSDVEGYYGYLHALFITHDLGHEKANVTYVNETPDGTLNKYFAGEAVMLLPFFFVAHGVAGMVGAPVDGLSWPYEAGISIAALCYALIGLLAFRRFLLRNGIGDGAVAFTLLLLGFGTQLVQYTAMQPGWSHVYSFALIALFLLVAQGLMKAITVRRCIGIGLLLGLITLVRPVNVLVVLALPVVWGNATAATLRGLFSRPLLLFATAACFVLVLSVQGFLWHAQVGYWIADGYKGEGFYWSHPLFSEVLFSVRRGLFVWAPVVLVAACAVLWCWWQDRVRALALSAYWIVNTYVISCWWIWYYGSGWGQRVYVDHYAVLFFPLAILLGRAGARWRTAFGVLLGMFALFTLAQFYQYNHRLLDEEGMDRKKYAWSFLRFDDAHRDRMGGRYRVPPFSPNGLDTLLHERWDVEGQRGHWNGWTLPWPTAPSGGTVALLNRAHEFGPSFTMQGDALPEGRAFFIAMGFERLVLRTDDSRSILVVCTIEDATGKVVHYERFKMDPVPPEPGVWEHLEYRMDLSPAPKGSRLKVYFWNPDWSRGFLADDLDITVMAVRPY